MNVHPTRRTPVRQARGDDMAAKQALNGLRAAYRRPLVALT